MAIGFVGDIHGWFATLRNYAEELEGKVSCLIQVGDFGLTASQLQLMASGDVDEKLKVPTYFIDGNHEYFETFYHHTEVAEISPNLFYVPRGTVMELDGKKIAFLGGAASIDKGYRLAQNLHWDARENILPTEVLRLYDNVTKDDRPVDILVAHCPPNSVVKANFDARNKLAYGVSLDWQDPNLLVVEEVWKKLGQPQMFCGHMHRSVVFDSVKGSRILAENELFISPSFLYSEDQLKAIQDKYNPKGIIISH